MKWEYICFISGEWDKSDALNRLGKDGWELVSVVYGDDADQFVYYLKRLKAPEVEKGTFGPGITDYL
jgi:hypothetical protein